MNDSKNPSGPEKINFTRTEFVMGAPDLKRCPADTGIEIAFAGRSNAGKSSALNRLTGKPKLARASKTPGRTQLLNFFSVGEGKRLVDLPGYGFARVPLAVKKTVEKNLTEYLHQRESLCGCLLLMDIRHPLQEFDQNFIGWSVGRGLSLHVLLTKADKLNPGAAKTTMLSTAQRIGDQFETAPVSIQTYSSLKGDGVPELKKLLSSWFNETSV